MPKVRSDIKDSDKKNMADMIRLGFKKKAVCEKYNITYPTLRAWVKPYMEPNLSVTLNNLMRSQPCRM